MSMVSYRCPASNEDVTTTIETGHDVLVRMQTFNLTLWAWCPHCLAGHQVKASQVRLRGDQPQDALEPAAGGLAVS